MTDQADRLADVFAPVLADLDLVLYDVEVTGSGRGRTLRVLIDRRRDEAGSAPAATGVAGGVDLDAVTAATEALAPVLDADPAVASVLPGPYLLEVSSPGLERPLRTPAHFQGARGSLVSLKVRDADGATHRNRVVLLTADDDGVEIEFEGTRERVSYADIVQARTVFEWGPTPKPGKAPKPKPKSKSTPTVSTSS